MDSAISSEKSFLEIQKGSSIIYPVLRCRRKPTELDLLTLDIRGLIS